MSGTEIIIYFDWVDRRAEVMVRTESSSEIDAILEGRLGIKSLIWRMAKKEAAREVTANINATLRWEVRLTENHSYVVVPCFVPSDSTWQLLPLSERGTRERRPVLDKHRDYQLIERCGSFDDALHACQTLDPPS